MPTRLHDKETQSYALHHAIVIHDAWDALVFCLCADFSDIGSAALIENNI